MQDFVYNFNLGGNYSSEIDNMITSTGKFTAHVDGALSAVTKYAGKLAMLDLVSSYTEKFNGALEGLGSSGIALDSQMHDLEAVAGVTGNTLDIISDSARKSAKAFGTDAGVAVEGYKLLLSQLSPEIAKCPEALAAMGKSIQITSKLMGNDGTAAAEVLTTAMNQYGVSLDDPIAASRKMAEMMNIMAAAGQAGSAELPAIKMALEQSGMAAKAANVEFAETNAAIQVLDKAGKKGAEGGVALRNTLAILGQGRFLPKETQQELAAAGIDVMQLADTSKSLKERLEMLKPIMGDASLFTKLFGLENANAARALVQGTDELGRLTEAISGTSSAEEQAAIVMDSYAERQARVRQTMEDFKISVFQCTGDLSLWVGTLTSALVPISQLIPLFVGIWKGIKAITAIKWATVVAGFTSFKVAAVSACRAVSGAIMNIPIVGWIAAAIAALVAVGAYFWNTSAKFRAMLKGLWASFKTVFTGIKDLASNVFGGIGDLINAAFSLDGKGIDTALSKLKAGFTNYGHDVGEAFNKAYDEEMQNSKAGENKKAGRTTSIPSGTAIATPTMGDITGGTAGHLSSGSGGSSSTPGESKIKNITVSVGQLVGKIEIHASTMKEGADNIKDAVTEALLSALNDTNLSTN